MKIRLTEIINEVNGLAEGWISYYNKSKGEFIRMQVNEDCQPKKLESLVELSDLVKDQNISYEKPIDQNYEIETLFIELPKKEPTKSLEDQARIWCSQNDIDFIEN